MPKNVQTTTQLHTRKVMLKILHASLQQYINQELQDIQVGFRKAEEPEIELPISIGSGKKQENSRKTFISASLTMLKSLTMDHNKLWKILQEMGITDHLTYFLRNLYAVQEWTGSKLGKEYIKVVYCHQAYLTYMQSTS